MLSTLYCQTEALLKNYTSAFRTFVMTQWKERTVSVVRLESVKARVFVKFIDTRNTYASVKSNYLLVTFFVNGSEIQHFEYSYFHYTEIEC
jgi:hypothetical protein